MNRPIAVTSTPARTPCSAIRKGSSFASRACFLLPSTARMPQDYGKLGAFYLGRDIDAASGQVTDDVVLYNSRDLTMS